MVTFVLVGIAALVIESAWETIGAAQTYRGMPDESDVMATPWQEIQAMACEYADTVLGGWGDTHDGLTLIAPRS